jgi:hypothetical protein
MRSKGIYAIALFVLLLLAAKPRKLSCLLRLCNQMPWKRV